MSNFFKNSQLRLLFSGTLFTVAFVWMAIGSYDVDEEEIRVFLILSCLLVFGLMIFGFFFSFLISFLKPGRDGMLAKIQARKAETHDIDEDH